MSIEELFTKYKIDTSDRPDPMLVMCCPGCGCWCTEDKAYSSSSELVETDRGVKQVHYCDYHELPTVINNAYEAGAETPAMKWDRKQLKVVISRLEDEIKHIEDLL